ncbi:MAG TPA: HAD family phosphatase [Syntrophus sp. (in: bacteria)]|nr:HAD family phosphatase [Syntrophus sp. (in: bacteria)]
MDNKIMGNGKIDVVLFDFGGVIAEEGFMKGLKIIAKANGLDEKEFIQAAFDVNYSTGYILGKVSEELFWNELKEKTGVKGDNADLKAEIFSGFVMRDWMIALVKKLKSENIIVGILSDQTDMIDRLNSQFDFYRWFDHVFNSYYLGKGKRDISLFDDIARTLNADPDRILFIDDDPGHVDRARRKGWKAIHYVDRESFEKDFEKIIPMRG